MGVDDERTRYRVKQGYTRKTEDVSFLLDQRGERKMVMGGKDTSYGERLEKSKLKKKKYEEGLSRTSGVIWQDPSWCRKSR